MVPIIESERHNYLSLPPAYISATSYVVLIIADILLFKLIFNYAAPTLRIHRLFLKIKPFPS